MVGSLEFDWRGGVNAEGFLDGFDKTADPIFVRCLSPREAADLISKVYSKILRDPVVEVRILDRSNRALAYVDGAVKTPQRLRIKREISLKELIVLSGGITDTASGDISIFRPENLSCSAAPAKASTKMVAIADLLSGKAESNPKILSGDIVTVVEALPVFVIGGVGVPKQISLRSTLTLSRAVLIAGGVAKGGTPDAVTIYRREDGTTKIIAANLDEIEAGKAEDPVLKPYDVVDVGERGKEKRMFPPVIDAAGSRFQKQAKMPIRVIE